MEFEFNLDETAAERLRVLQADGWQAFLSKRDEAFRT